MTSMKETGTKDRRLYNTVARSILESIDGGTYPAGSRLPAERNLAEQYKVSRVTIRQALIALQARGKVEIKTGSGAYVLDGAEPGRGGFPHINAFEVTEARSLFESEVAALAALHISDEALDQLAAYIEQMASDNPDEEEAAEEADRNFHLTIASASGNSAARHIVESLWKMRSELPQVREVYEAVCLDDTSQRGNEHMEIYVALKNRDPAAARVAMRKHFNRLLESMLDITEEQAVEKIRKEASASRHRFLKIANL